MRKEESKKLLFERMHTIGQMPINEGTKKKAYLLKKGDKLRNGAEILGVATQGMNIPSGKVEVIVKYPNKDPYKAYWNKNTEIGIAEGMNEHDVDPETIKKAASEYPERDESPSYQVKLDNITKYAAKLHDLIEDFDELPTWVQDKITIAEHNMEAIHGWIMTLGHEEDEHGELIDENNEMDVENPCWGGYEMVGMKKKSGKEVPNCVPKK
jgi:hypothetical protein